ncbi:GNAT family N-acetyltransferase [Kribbella sp. VKM Ac-2568]|uniref:GNAT family N-acetyltransferase n=1 Tax=Kribbella sp. VKM Ac-2568 TaxID=2512219 RepID=UPI0010459F68|nr:GNAT family N-acetyltransferase [Kribbella sp. VKM Ac-2568]TCM43468.1 putative GNAT family acetyltransferase [Kribbella sp. VKM Ac-2568]
MDVLTNPAYYALAEAHADLAEVKGQARRYPAQLAPFLGLPDDVTDQDWADAAELVGTGNVAALMRPELSVPDVFKVVRLFDLVQLVAPESFGAVEPDAVGLGPDDLADMVALTTLTEPGPFRSRTIEFGGYLGLRRGGDLIAMAGERFRPPGYVEISAVCTDPKYRGRGLASRLMRAVAAGIEAEGNRPFLHASGTNVNAIRLYEGLGFTVSNRMKVTLVEPL